MLDSVSVCLQLYLSIVGDKIANNDMHLLFNAVLFLIASLHRDVNPKSIPGYWVITGN
jgi:hypothetical protein